MPEKILIVEDSHILRKSLIKPLESESFEVAEARDGVEGLAMAQSFEPDLVIMDINMPRMDGLEALRRLREFSTVPVLILSVRDTMDDKITGLELGADDYLSKPFGVEELLARVKALLRRQRMKPPATGHTPVLRLGGGHLTVDVAESQVLLDGQEISLTPTESRLFFALAERPGHAVGREKLIRAAWPDDPEASAANLKLYILYLRRKIEPDPAHPRYLLTARGRGYSLAAA